MPVALDDHERGAATKFPNLSLVMATKVDVTSLSSEADPVTVTTDRVPAPALVLFKVIASPVNPEPERLPLSAVPDSVAVIVNGGCCPELSVTVSVGALNVPEMVCANGPPEPVSEPLPFTTPEFSTSAIESVWPFVVPIQDPLTVALTVAGGCVVEVPSAAAPPHAATTERANSGSVANRI